MKLTQLVQVLLNATAKTLLIGCGLLAVSTVHAERFRVDVVDANGDPIPGFAGFRYLLQEDTTYGMDPSNPAALDQQLSLNFHKSYHPPALYTGSGNTTTVIPGNPNIQTAHVAGDAVQGNADSSSVVFRQIEPGRYYLSVFPYSGFAMGGTPVTVLPGGTNADNVTVVVEAYPLPTTQIGAYLFHDCYPLNGAPDLPEELAPTNEQCTGTTPDLTQFSVTVEEPGGKYGIAGGQVIQDAFGNPLGTVYLNQNPDTPATGPGGCPARADGTCADGTLHPTADGTLIIKNLAPGKYGLIVTPPAGWQQTSTIEGSPTIDAWVKANEPPFFVEFGLPGPHVFIGFTRALDEFEPPQTAQDIVSTVTGTVTDMHMSRPPSTAFFSGRPFPQCWIAINEGGPGPRANLFSGPCASDSGFVVDHVPPGSYELKVLDNNLDVVIATLAFTVDPNGTCNGGQSCAFGEVPVFNWFNRLSTFIFNDTNQNGFWDSNESSLGAESGPVNVRWRDGTIYQSFPTDFDGAAPFDELFPFFHWLVAEVGFTDKKATGATFVADAGGEITPNTGEFPDYGELQPQLQNVPDCTVGAVPPETDCSYTGGTSRTETGPVLTAGFQGFLGQTNVMHFGKADYVTLDFNSFPPTYVGENGGISGMVLNTVTRAEDDPRYAVAEEWEAGVPRVQVNLYADGDIDAPVISPPTAFPNGPGDVDWNGNGINDADDNVIDDIDGDGSVTLSDVDNHPLGWAENGGQPGPEDIDRNGNGVFDLGDAVAVTWTDSWDDSTPTGCQGQNNLAGIADDRCFDGMRNWSQIRPGVFDGGYAFTEYDLDHLLTVNPAARTAILGFYDYVASNLPGNNLTLGLLPSDYIVETATPVGFNALREHHKNVDFGDEYVPAPSALPHVCVGPDQVVPDLFAIATKDGSGDAAQIVPGITVADAAAPFAGDLRPVCDQKKVPLFSGQNAAADFFLVSNVPFAGNVTGMILNDLANEFNPNSPNFGEKFAPPMVPVAFYDWNGAPLNRVYADQFGRYNLMVPSTYSANLPIPSGMSPNMLLACMNDAGPIADPLNPDEMIVDPNFNPSFSQFCYTFQYMPGSATYLDTPVLAVAAYTNPTTYPLDCEVPHRTPMIRDVRNDTRGLGPIALPGDVIRIRSMGRQDVPNPAWDGVDPSTRTVRRDYRFGGSGQRGSVWLEDADGNRTELPVENGSAGWNNNRILVELPGNTAPGEYQVVVSRAQSGQLADVESEIGVTLTVGIEDPGSGDNILGVRPNGQPYNIWSVPSDFPTIQSAIDHATVAAGDMILVEPGIYDELVIMWKPVKLQGWGAGSVFLNARQVPTEKIQAWRERIEELRVAGDISPLPGQEAGGIGGFPALGAEVFPTEEGAGIFVVGLDTTTTGPAGANRFNILANRGARIDGFQIVGASQGGGIVVNGYAPFLNIGNNRLTANSGFFGGGIRVGHPNLVFQDVNDDLFYTDAVNDRIRIHHNQIIKNGGMGGAGGGISLHTGADQYRVQENWICGNFSQGNGAGIGHLGRSNGGRIENNNVLFNESFSQANSVHGGGIFIGGQAPLQGATVSDGTGNVTIDANRIHGNQAGAGDGGGIAIVNASGVDVAENLGDNTAWYDVNVFNNMITNNVSGLAGALTIQDSVEVHVLHNTIAHNDSTATAALAFTPGFFSQSNALPAGVVSRVHTPAMANLLANVTDYPVGAGRVDEYIVFSDANLNNNIVFANRSFYWGNFDDPATAIIETGLFPMNCTAPNPADCNLANPEDFSYDLAVLDGTVETGDELIVRHNLLTDTPENVAAYSNVNWDNVFTLDPSFVNPLFNEGREGLDLPEFTVLQTAAAFDEGGNFIQVAPAPLTIVELGSPPNQRVLYDYHIQASSPAVDAGQDIGLGGPLGQDFDGDPRSNGDENDIGADELP